MALEPRGALRSAIVSRRESVCSEAEAIEEEQPASSWLVVLHEEPDFPIHPALEYEVLAAVDITKDDDDDDDEQQHSIVRSSCIRPGEADEETTTSPATRRQRSGDNLKLALSFVFLVISGVGTVVSAKLQAIPMYNYPNFLNLFSNLLYIPICFAYIVPASKWQQQQQQQQQSTSSSTANRFQNTQSSTSSSFCWPKRRLMKRFAIMGALDCVSTTLQTFAAVYLPGPLLIVLPQAVIPVSLVLTYALSSSRQEGWPQWMGATTVVVGILIVLVPVLRSQNAPEFYCEAEDQDYDCPLCQQAVTQEACLAAQTTRPESKTSSSSAILSSAVARFLEETMVSQQSDDAAAAACRWLPFEESLREKEFLEIVWSLILTASTVPMALSAIYKQRAMLSLCRPQQNHDRNQAADTTTRTSPTLPRQQQQTVQNPPPAALYVSGWIAVFQFICSIAVTVPAGMLASPSLRPWEVPENLVNGMLCYAGQGVVETGCHPDTLCASERAALWVNVTVLCHFVYTISMMLVLQYSGSSSVLLFLALTAIVPIGNLVFALPIMPIQSRTVVQTSDLAGLILILSGLILYRFSDPDESSNTDKGENSAEAQEERSIEQIPWEETDEQSLSAIPLLGSLVPRANQTSYTLIRKPLLTGEV